MTGAPASGVAQQKTISQSGLGRCHLPGIKQRVKQEVLQASVTVGGCWNQDWYRVKAASCVSYLLQTTFSPPSALVLFILCSSQPFFCEVIHYCKYFLLFGSEWDFSLSMNQMVSVAHRETVYHVCLLREHHWGFTVRPGSSFVCKTLHGVCLSLLGHQMGGVYGIRWYHEWQDVHTFAIKDLKVSLVFVIDSSPEPHTSGKADTTKAFEPHLSQILNFFNWIIWDKLSLKKIIFYSI